LADYLIGLPLQFSICWRRREVFVRPSTAITPGTHPCTRLLAFDARLGITLLGDDLPTEFSDPLPSTRFILQNKQIHDKATGLIWRKNANLTGQPVTWDDAVQAVRLLNQDSTHGMHPDDSKHWRLPNINELKSLVDCSQHSPALVTNMKCL
jgi:hypothetical protein